MSPERTIQSGAFQSPKMSVTPSEPHSPDRVCAAIRFEEGSRFQSPQMSVTPREPHSPDGVFAAFRFEEGSREFEERSRETSSVISGSQVCAAAPSAEPADAHIPDPNRSRQVRSGAFGSRPHGCRMGQSGLRPQGAFEPR